MFPLIDPVEAIPSSIVFWMVASNFMVTLGDARILCAMICPMQLQECQS